MPVRSPLTFIGPTLVGTKCDDHYILLKTMYVSCMWVGEASRMHTMHIQIGLCAQNVITIVDAIVNIIGENCTRI